MTLFPSIRIEGGLLGPDVLDLLLAVDLPGQRALDFGLDSNRNLHDEIASAYTDAKALWGVFQNRLKRLPETDQATRITRESWIIPFLGLFGYELHYNTQQLEADGQSFAISHRAGESDDTPPIHIVGARQPLGRLQVGGKQRLSPHSLLQEYLNRTEHLWGLVTNGYIVRLLRDSTFVRKQAYIEFDLEALLEEQRFQDFVALYRLIHRTRLPKSIEDVKGCMLEAYFAHSIEQGGRVREHLRDGVEHCITILANGFLQHVDNHTLRQQIAPDYSDQDRISPQELYHQLLRLVYRFLFLLVSEDRGLVSSDILYREYYGIARLRLLLDRRSAFTNHDDVWQSLRVLWKMLSDEQLACYLHLAPLNGELFAAQKLDDCWITNRELLRAFWNLTWYQESPSAPPRRVNYAAMDVEELGSVYESLLEFHPVISFTGKMPTFELVPEGHERRSTGSHYTPQELVAPLIEHALMPVVRERLDEAKRFASQTKFPADPSQASAIIDTKSAAPDSHENVGKLRGAFITYAQQQLTGVQESGNPTVEDSHHNLKPENIAHTTRSDSMQVSPHPLSDAQLQSIWSRTPIATRYAVFASHMLLHIRVCDLACGSGHFLLAASRRLGKELARINSGEDEPSPEWIRKSIREVVIHCIYGVDKNPLAVELCRVALWLESYAEGKPLTFLDHRIRCGDSLVGVYDIDLLTAGIPDEAFKPVAADDKKSARDAKRYNEREKKEELSRRSSTLELKQISQWLASLSELSEDTVEQVRAKVEAYQQIEQYPDFQRLRLACDVWTSAFFQEFSESSPEHVTTKTLWTALDSGKIGNKSLIGVVSSIALKQRFFHWELEFPEVFTEGGFDVILGNPPFFGGQHISGEFGDKYRNYLTTIYNPFIGTADICASFFRRAIDIIKSECYFGLIATNTIAQGDTRQSSLAHIIKNGNSIEYAKRFVKWIGLANVEVNLLCVNKGIGKLDKILDERSVSFISSRLDTEPEHEAIRLHSNSDKTFQGSILQGIGFVLDPDETQQLILMNEKNKNCLFPFLSGEDLNSTPNQTPTRYVINFFNWSLQEAEQYPELLDIVKKRVKPDRDNIKRDRNKTRWWIYAENRPGLYNAIKNLKKVMIRSRVSELHMITLIPNGWVYSDATIIFAFDDYFHFSLLQSNVHEAWVWRYSSSLESRNRYTPTDCFETFAFPQSPSEQALGEAERIGELCHEHRRQLMSARGIGLTKTYNLFNNEECKDTDINRLRELHRAMDVAILDCYGWNDIEPGHGFYENERGQKRYTIHPEARVRILRRLLALNLEIAGKEAVGGSAQS